MNRIVPAFVLSSVISLAVAQRVRVDFDHACNFANYHTYSWAEQPDGQPMNQLMTQRVAAFVEEALAAKHLRRVPSGGDLLIHFQMRVSEQEQYITYTNGFGFGWNWGSTISTTTSDPFLEGALTVDLVDARRNQLVFQGVSTDYVSSKPQKNTKRLAKGVNKIFEKYPPR